MAIHRRQFLRGLVALPLAILAAPSFLRSHNSNAAVPTTVTHEAADALADVIGHVEQRIDRMMWQVHFYNARATHEWSLLVSHKYLVDHSMKPVDLLAHYAPMARQAFARRGVL